MSRHYLMGLAVVAAATLAVGDPTADPKLPSRAEMAKVVLDPATGDKARYEVICGLARSGYCRASAEALAVVACGRTYGVSERWNAAMGLINFTFKIPPDVKAAVQDKLYGALEAEKATLPDGVIRAMVAWGDADRVQKVLGDSLRGLNAEIAVLAAVSSRRDAIARLREIYETSAPVAGDTNMALSRRWHVGAALIAQRDKWGVDVVLECLTGWETEDANWTSLRQSQLHTSTYLAGVLGKDFGYDDWRNWTPQLNGAIADAVRWWTEHRDTWRFEQGGVNQYRNWIPSL